MKQKSARFRKPNPFIYYPVTYLAGAFLHFKLRPEYKLGQLKKIKGPAIIMCSHTSNLDFVLVAAGLLPKRPTYIMSNHFFNHPKISRILAPLHAIPKKMFCADINAVRRIIQAKEAGGIIIMFPEGRLSCYGHTLQIADGTAELIKKLGIDVYWLTENGAYKTLPKWGRAGLRKGKVSVEGGKLFRGSELAHLSIEEIRQTLAEAVYHDDEKAFEGVEYKCKAPALGLEGILYKCPVCGEEFRMKTDENTLSCEACGESWTLDESYVLHGKIFDSINHWFAWEQQLIKLDAGIETDCLLATPDETGILNREAGKGHFTIDRELITFKGECFGKPLEFTEKTSSIKAFPCSVGDHFDIYSGRIMYQIIPQPDSKTSIKFVQYLDKVTEEKSTY